MWKSLFPACACAAIAFAQPPAAQVEFANLREDVRGLTQRIGEMTLKLEQLERENAELRRRLGAADKSYVTLAQLNEVISDLQGSIRATVAGAKTETLQQVGAQMEKLAKQTNAALESLAKVQAARPVVPAPFSDDYPANGVKYTVQKGDSLAIIARKTGAKQQDIINANKLTDPSHIVVGQALFIPVAK